MTVGNVAIPSLGDDFGFSPFSALMTPGQVAVQAGGLQGLTFNTGVLVVPAGVPFTVQKDFTNAQLAALSGTPFNMLPAPGTTFAWQVLYAWAELVKTVASGGPAPTFRIRYTGTTPDLVAAFTADVQNAPRSFFSPSLSAAPGINSTTVAALANLGVDVDLSAGGIGASNATARVGICAFKRSVAGY
jgi:hypothetical protein